MAPRSSIKDLARVRCAILTRYLTCKHKIKVSLKSKRKSTRSLKTIITFSQYPHVISFPKRLYTCPAIWFKHPKKGRSNLFGRLTNIYKYKYQNGQVLPYEISLCTYCLGWVGSSSWGITPSLCLHQNLWL